MAKETLKYNSLKTVFDDYFLTKSLLSNYNYTKTRHHTNDLLAT